MRSFLAAVQFLTRIPLRLDASSAELTWSYAFYPVVGALLGGSAALLHAGTSFFLPGNVCAVLVIAYLIVITGALHEDGWGDVMDALGGHTIDERLRILKDSRMGSFGSLGLVLLVLMKYAFLTSMDAPTLHRALIAASTISRWTVLPLGYWFPAAQAGMGSTFIKTLRTPALVAASLFTIGLMILVAGVRSPLIMLVAVLLLGACGSTFRIKFGGITGDCFGAASQLVEVATYVGFLI